MNPSTPRRASRRGLLLASAAAIALGSATSVWAQAWPTKPVRIVVPFAAGGSTDVVARMLGQKLGEIWGQPVVVENRAGAGGNLGADVVAKSDPDGYTLVFASGSITINPNLYERMPFDTMRDLVPITNVASGPMLVVVQDRSPYKTLQDLIADAKARPGQVNFGSAGVGSQVHMATENFSYAAGIEMQHVPYRGESVALTDLVGGQVQVVVGNIAAANALVGPDRLRPLAVTGRQRSPLLPDVPTVAESGVPGFENTGWFGLLARAGTPAAVVDKIHRDTLTVLADSQIRGRLYVLGMSAVGNSPAELKRQMEAEMQRWAEVIKSRNLKAR